MTQITNNQLAKVNDKVINVITLDGHRHCTFKTEERMLKISDDEFINDYIRPSLYALRQHIKELECRQEGHQLEDFGEAKRCKHCHKLFKAP